MLIPQQFWLKTFVFFVSAKINWVLSKAAKTLQTSSHLRRSIYVMRWHNCLTDETLWQYLVMHSSSGLVFLCAIANSTAADVFEVGFLYVCYVPILTTMTDCCCALCTFALCRWKNKFLSSGAWCVNAPRTKGIFSPHPNAVFTRVERFENTESERERERWKCECGQTQAKNLAGKLLQSMRSLVWKTPMWEIARQFLNCTT